MPARLKQKAAAVDVAKLSFIVNDRRVDLFKDEIGRARSLKERLEARFNYADELLKAGRVQDSLEALDALETDTRANAPPAAWTATRNLVLMQRGLAYMRLAEEQNCHAANTPRLLPVPDPRPGDSHEARGVRRGPSSSWRGSSLRNRPTCGHDGC